MLLPFLVLLRVCMETYTNSFDASWHLSGNALVGALPMLALGYYIHSKEEVVLRVSGKAWLGLLAASYALMFVTVNFRVFGLDISQIFKISTAALSFICCIRYGDCLKESFLTRLGKSASLNIYVYHFLIGVAIRNILLYLSVGDFLSQHFSRGLSSASVLYSRMQ